MFSKNVKKQFVIVALFALTFLQVARAQSLRINEVSQGASGSKEYVELVVVGPALTSCSAQPQCLDLRGWILDDNNGYFSNGVLTGTGLAAGAIRFANDPIWQCVNPGTIILIYNDNDVNADIPADDLTNSDANCRMIIPVSSALLERHESEPNTTSMNYATTGWVSGGNWGPISMANGDDSFQIYDPTNLNTPVHGVSWGNNNTNTIIYFSGAAGGLVFSCDNTTSTDFLAQSNWISAAVASGQTAGLPNSTPNASLLGGMNLNCGVGSPISIVVTPTDETCVAPCNGSATVTVSGGQAPYATPIWSNGITANQVSNLCPGSYSVEITDANGCSGNQTFTIAAAGGMNLTNSGNVTICAGETTTISASGATSFSWDNGLGNGNSFDVNPTETTTYTATGSSNGCSSTTAITVTVTPTPNVNAGSTIAGCVGDSIQLNATGASNLAWENGITNGEYVVLEEGTYQFTVVGTSGTCVGKDSLQITITNCNWELEMPNVITPNTDIVNDYFIPVTQKNVTITQTTILNRWGNEVFNTSNPLLIWDGRAQNGQLASEGTYFYIITFVDGTLQTHTKQGYVELVKK